MAKGAKAILQPCNNAKSAHIGVSMLPIEEALDSIQKNISLESKIERALQNKQNWTPNLCILAQVIGDIQALIFCEAFGGISVYIPTEPRKTSPISKVLSDEAYILLTSSHLRGAYFICPMQEMKESKKHIALELLRKNYSQRQIALKLGLHEKTVLRLARKVSNTQQQYTLI